ncbi:isoaspartyl peptidase/L-asparaginase family protein [Lacibacter sp. H407]|uniref:isoaspartyl peptidase/L-asparaginase family protein n=1 Tax=Lacibacter sp. H407 TaxID=3133423 RepID=UPI0030C1DD46
MRDFSIAIHGGAGTILKADMTPELEAAYVSGLAEALTAGYTLLAKGGTALDAVAAAVRSLEECILFNAGRGSVFTKTGGHEMDAAIMDGKTLGAGAVAGVSSVKNPVLLAKLIMEKSEHVMLSGDGALQFAKQHQLQLEEEDYFFSQFRYDQWQLVKNEDTTSLDHNIHIEKKFGTVGAVACDANGNLAAATSTGGMTNKNYNRIGDTPVIGSGTYANNQTCAISCTGHGELFLRAVAAYDVSCLMEYKGMTLQEAMEKVTLDKLVKLKGEGGMIGVDANGNAAMVFNSDGMYRAMQSNRGEKQIAIYR